MNLHISLNESGYPIEESNKVKLPNIQALKENSFHHKSGEDLMNSDYNSIRFKKRPLERQTDS